MTTSAQYPILCSPAELASRLGDPDVFIIDTRFRLDDPAYGAGAYAAGHVPGALYLDLDNHLSAPVVPGQTGRHPLPDPALLEARLLASGLRQDSLVVVYDDGPALFAARAWWLLNWLGHQQVRVLNGGWAAWQAAGLPISTAVAVPELPGNFIARPRSDLLVDAGAIVDDLSQGHFQLLDARAPERFRGELEPIDPVAGHIPGAHCVPCAGNVDNTGCFLPAAQLAERFPPLSSGQQRVAYCGSGVTACHNILAAALAGLPWPKLYAGSWSEWITDPARPVARG